MLFVSRNLHTRYLEEWSPTAQEDAYRWVPIGLYYDLIDPASNSVEPISGVLDQVDYFTNSQLWQAITSPNMLTVNQFRNSLNNIQPARSTTTNDLFVRYNQ